MTLKTWRVTFTKADFDPEIISFDRYDFNSENPTDEEQRTLAIKVAHELTGEWGSADELETPSAAADQPTEVNESNGVIQS